MRLDHPLQLTPEYRDYVWGGTERLRPGQLTAEAWVIYENDVIASGPLAGWTLSQVAASQPEALLGRRALQRTGERFPLLIKLLDCAQWLSLQVHPDDEAALALEGPGHFGKTEAWHILAAQPEATLIAGIRPGVSAEQLSQAIGQKALLDLVEYKTVQAGDTVFMPAGTIHALGPGLFLYEVQQTSDLTYRVYDWDRPQVNGRILHVEQGRSVSRVETTCRVTPRAEADRQTLVASPFFTLERLDLQSQPARFDTLGESFHALTVIGGAAQIKLAGGALTLEKYASAVIPAEAGEYQIVPQGECQILKASMEEY